MVEYKYFTSIVTLGCGQMEGFTKFPQASCRWDWQATKEPKQLVIEYTEECKNHFGIKNLAADGAVSQPRFGKRYVMTMVPAMRCFNAYKEIPAETEDHSDF